MIYLIEKPKISRCLICLNGAANCFNIKHPCINAVDLLSLCLRIRAWKDISNDCIGSQNDSSAQLCQTRVSSATRTASFQNVLSFHIKTTKASESKNTNTDCHYYTGLTYKSVPRIDGLLQSLAHSTLLHFLGEKIFK